MKSAQFQLATSDGGRAFVYRWLPDGETRATLLVIHGMAEHAGRYARLAEALTADGIAVYAQDLPGHGRSVRNHDELGYVAARDGWTRTLSAINAVRERAEKEQHGVPLFVLGHSMGSFLLQDYVIEHGTGLAGAIFSAGTAELGPLRVIGLALVRAEAAWNGGRHRSAVAERMSFREFNRRFRPNRTDFDWLSRDEAEVDQYIADRLCGFRCSCRLWIDLLEAAGRLGDPARLARVPGRLPVRIIGGSEDPATRGESGLQALHHRYQGLGLPDVSLRIYPGARHELLNETCRDEVTEDLRQWLAAHR